MGPALGTRCGEPWLDAVHDGPGDVVLQVEDIREVAVVGLGPEVLVRARIDELRRDADSISGPHDGTFHHGIGVQQARDLGKRRPLPL